MFSQSKVLFGRKSRRDHRKYNKLRLWELLAQEYLMETN